MHRATPLDANMRAYSAGGARGVINKVDDSKLMQEVNANFMAGETHDAIEAPQNYGFTSVNMGPDESGSAEHFSSFMGGSRTLPAATVIDDRRHRLKGLDEGDVAMYRTKSDQLQFHLAQSGAYLTGPDSKKLRMQLVQGQQQGQQGQGSGAAQGTQGGQGGAQQKTGQQAQYKQDSKQYFEVSGSMTQSVNKQHQIVLQDKKTGVEVNTDNKVYLGAVSGQGSFLPVMLVDGSPAKNVLGLKGGSTSMEEATAETPGETIIARLLREIEELRARVGALEALQMA